MYKKYLRILTSVFTEAHARMWIFHVGVEVVNCICVFGQSCAAFTVKMGEILSLKLILQPQGSSITAPYTSNPSNSFEQQVQFLVKVMQSGTEWKLLFPSVLTRPPSSPALRSSSRVKSGGR